MFRESLQSCTHCQSGKCNPLILPWTIRNGLSWNGFFYLLHGMYTYCLICLFEWTHCIPKNCLQSTFAVFLFDCLLVEKVDNKKKFEIYLFYHLHFYKKLSLFISPIFVEKLTRSNFLNSLQEQITTTVILKTYTFSCHNTSNILSMLSSHKAVFIPLVSF